jgi:hypothetical protein
MFYQRLVDKLFCSHASLRISHPFATFLGYRIPISTCVVRVLEAMLVCNALTAKLITGRVVGGRDVRDTATH